MSERWHKAADFSKYRISRVKKGVCHICGHCVYYGIRIETWANKDFSICSDCAKIIMKIRLSRWCI